MNRIKNKVANSIIAVLSAILVLLSITFVHELYDQFHRYEPPVEYYVNDLIRGEYSYNLSEIVKSKCIKKQSEELDEAYYTVKYLEASILNQAHQRSGSVERASYFQEKMSEYADKMGSLTTLQEDVDGLVQKALKKNY